MRLLVFFIALIFTLSVKAQYFPVYSQYMLNGLVINPAYAGSRDVLSTSLSYRKQWVGFEAVPITETFSAHMPLRNKSIALGVLLINDKIGINNNLSLFTNYAYRIRMTNNGMLALGLKAGFSYLKDDLSKITVREQNDYVFTNSSTGYFQPNAGFGLYYYNPKFFTGVSIPTLLSYKRTDDGLGYKPINNVKNYNILLSGGAIFQLADNVKIKPSTLVQMQLNSTVQYDLNCNLIFLKDGQLWIGGSYRVKDAIVGLVEFQINTELRIGYSYDFTLSELNKYSYGSHEIMIRYEFKYIVKALTPRFF